MTAASVLSLQEQFNQTLYQNQFNKGNKGTIIYQVVVVVVVVIIIIIIIISIIIIIIIDNAILNKYYRKWLNMPISGNISHLRLPTKSLGLNVSAVEQVYNN